MSTAYDDMSKEDRAALDAKERAREKEEQAALPYAWDQELKTVTVTVPLPAGTRSRDLIVVMDRKKLKAFKGASEPILDGELFDEIAKDDSSWTIEDSVLSFELEKASARINSARWWPHVLTHHPKIDTTKIQPENSKLSDLDGETRGMVEKMMYDNQQKAMGRPTSDEQRKVEMLEKFKAQHPEMDFSNSASSQSQQQLVRGEMEYTFSPDDSSPSEDQWFRFPPSLRMYFKEGNSLIKQLDDFRKYLAEQSQAELTAHHHVETNLLDETIAHAVYSSFTDELTKSRRRALLRVRAKAERDRRTLCPLLSGASSDVPRAKQVQMACSQVQAMYRAYTRDAQDLMESSNNELASALGYLSDRASTSHDFVGFTPDRHPELAALVAEVKAYATSKGEDKGEGIKKLEAADEYANDLKRLYDTFATAG